MQDAELEEGSKLPGGILFSLENCTGMLYFLGCKIACDTGSFLSTSKIKVIVYLRRSMLAADENY